MKIIKLKRTPPELWMFAKDNLPSSLRATRWTDGYGCTFGINVKEKSLQSYVPCRRGIATIDEKQIKLFQPQYFSDMEDICREYEAETGIEVTLSYWDD